MSLELKQVRKSYREPGGGVLPVLDIEHFHIGQGEQVVLLGPSGGGKTTLLHTIAGITRPDSGQVLVGGIDIVPMMEAVRDRFRSERIGYVFQTFNLLPAFTALENVLLGISFSGKRAGRDRAVELLRQVGLEHRLHHRPQEMSVGEQQRVSVARALAKSPVLLLADEPTANVDTSNQQRILDLIRTACREQNVSLLLVTHTPDVARQFERVDELSQFNHPGAAR